MTNSQNSKENFSFEKGILAKMPKEKRSQIIGEIALLMLASKTHRKYLINDIGSVIFPAIHFNQFRIYKDKDKNPIALITWAFLSDEIEEKYLQGNYHLKPQDWKSGSNGCVIDFIAPFGHAKKIIQDLRSNLFVGMEGKALRVKDDDKKRVIKLKAKNKS